MKSTPVNATEDSIPMVVPDSMMVFAAHPDDELLSAGGTMMKYRALGTKITVVVATGGKGGYATEKDKDSIEMQRKHEMELVEKELDVKFIILENDELETNRKYISQFTNLLREKRPQVIILPHNTDTHRTHRKLAQIVKEAIYHAVTGKAYGGAGKDYLPAAVYYYESPSCKFQYIQGSVFVGVDITPYWQRKVDVFKKAYATQLDMLERVVPWAEKTALLRGNEIGAEYAEAFIPATDYVPLRLILF
jgi:LmbE family N-acetylglucosaminyl deacetylase